MIDLRSAILASAPLVFGLACGPAAAADAAADRVVNIALEDQFKNRHETLRGVASIRQRPPPRRPNGPGSRSSVRSAGPPASRPPTCT